MSIESVLHEHFFHFIFFLCVGQLILMILEVGMPVDPEQVQGCASSVLFVQYFKLDVLTFRRDFNPDSIIEVVYLGD